MKHDTPWLAANWRQTSWKLRSVMVVLVAGLALINAAKVQIEAALTERRDALANAQLEARLAALKQLQERVQTQGKVQPWLKKHELDGLPRLWQKLQIEAGDVRVARDRIITVPQASAQEG